MIVAEVQAPISSDHDFNTEHLISSVTYRMNITSDTGDSLYSSGYELGGYVYVSVHDATFYPSTGINNATNLLCLMRNSIGTNESPYPFYLVILDKDGGGNHNHKHIKNQLAFFCIFILVNMDNALVFIFSIQPRGPCLF